MTYRDLHLFVCCFVAVCACNYSFAAENPPAFPGAEGPGARTPGGRNSKVYVVTTLEDFLPGEEGPIAGSLRQAIESKGPRIVVFRVGGYIDLKANLTIRNPYITIAGQTAPGDGICLRNYQFGLGNTHDCIVRYIRSRPGDHTSKPGDLDAITVWNSHNIIIDHCSAMWSTDECLSVTHGSENVTVQWCIIAEGLTDHSYGSLIGSSKGGRISFHHNIYANNRSRNPRPTAYPDSPGPTIDFRNNLIYNWSGVAGYTGSGNANEIEPVSMNYVGNYLKPGPSAPERDDLRKAAFIIYQGAAIELYVADNHMAGFPAANIDNWQMIDTSRHNVAVRLAHPIAMPRIGTDTAAAAYEKVLAKAGACLPARDAVDRRIIESIRRGSGRVLLTVKDIGGWPKLKRGAAQEDSDGDGMPDVWEDRHGLNPKDGSDNALDNDGDIYINIEEHTTRQNCFPPFQEDRSITTHSDKSHSTAVVC